MPPPNIIKLSQTVWELWPAQDFGLKGDKFIKQELSFLHATLLLDLIYVPILLNYLKQYRSYCLHKISTSGERST